MAETYIFPIFSYFGPEARNLLRDRKSPSYFAGSTGEQPLTAILNYLQERNTEQGPYYPTMHLNL